MSLNTLTGLSARALWALLAVVCLGLVAIAVVLQLTKALEPCPLCILQRYGFLAAALFATLAAATAQRRLQWTGGVLTLGALLAGGGVAVYHTWMLAHPETSTCSFRLFRLVNDSMLADAWPLMFRGAGDCLAADWTLLGLTMPHWSLISFIGLAAAAVFALLRLRRPARGLQLQGVA